MCLNLSVWTIKHINTYFCTFGTIPNPGKKLGQKHGAGGKHLRDVDVEVCGHDCIVPFIQSISSVSAGDDQANP